MQMKDKKAYPGPLAVLPRFPKDSLITSCGNGVLETSLILFF
jgi:hypothetical protein